MRRVRLSLIVAALVVFPATAVMADLDVDWSVTPPEAGDVVDGEVHITGQGSHRLLTLDEPGVDADVYIVRGSIRFEDVVGTGYLEMWSHFSDGGAYFSRTLAAAGPMAALSGDSSGRVFELPFFLNGAAAPERIEINLVLPEGGEVWIGSLELEGFGGSSPWWSARQSGALGAVVGSLGGIMGAVVGGLASRRRARRLVNALIIVGVVVGVTATGAGVAALVVSQPSHVSLSLLLIGLVVTVLYGSLFRILSRAYAAAELHRIAALDA